MDRIPLYLIALIMAIAKSPLDIFDIHAWNVGTAHTEPWRQKDSTVARLTSAFRAWTQLFWRHRHVIAAACLMAFLVIAPDRLHAHQGLSIAIVGQIASTQVAQWETDLRAKQAEVKTYLTDLQRACDEHEEKDAAGKVIGKGRLMTADEKAKGQALLNEAKAIQTKIDGAKNDASMLASLQQLTEGMDAQDRRVAAATGRIPGRGVRVNALGQAFIDSETYAWIKKTSGSRNSAGWQSPSSELPGLDMMAATLTTDPASGGDLVVPQYIPGIVEMRFRPLVVADLVAPGTTDSNLVTFMKETTATNAAATVTEAAAKPESTLVFDAASAPVRKIATWLPVTDEMLEDVPQIRSYVEQRLRLFVQLAEDDQLLNGDGIAPNILGLRNQVGMQADLARGADTNADAIRKQMTLIATNSFLMVDGVAMHPTNWQTVELSKDANGQYYGAGPFAPPGPARIWGVPVAVTLAMTAGVALPGAYRQGAQFFRKGGLRVDASNSHNDYFVKNLTAIRAEERGALAVYRPGAFGEVTGLN